MDIKKFKRSVKTLKRFSRDVKIAEELAISEQGLIPKIIKREKKRKEISVIYYRQEEIQQYIDDNIDNVGIDEDTHHNLFNQDYYIIGTYDAKQWLGDKAFDVISIIKEYEEDNFGEVSTDFGNPEAIVNMYVYIVGEYLLNEMQRS